MKTLLIALTAAVTMSLAPASFAATHHGKHGKHAKAAHAHKGQAAKGATGAAAPAPAGESK